VSLAPLGGDDLHELLRRARIALGVRLEKAAVPECHPSVSLVPAEFVFPTGLADAQCFVGWEELVPAGPDVAELATADVVGQMLDVNVDPRAVG
jgi:hypothetical protein